VGRKLLSTWKEENEQLSAGAVKTEESIEGKRSMKLAL
jgi:hypothetical protein